MAIFSMHKVLAVMPQADTVFTIDGAVYTVAANTPVTTKHHTIDVPGGTVLAVMHQAQMTHGNNPLQCFSLDEIVTVT